MFKFSDDDAYYRVPTGSSSLKNLFEKNFVAHDVVFDSLESKELLQSL